MPKEVFGPDYVFLPAAAVLSDDEVVRLVRCFVQAGVVKARITGGEPLLREGLARLVGRLAALPGLEDLSLTTNGWMLAKLAPSLAEAGLRRVNVSLDALSDETFGRMNGRELGAKRVLQGIDAALAAGLGVKINMVLQRGVNEHEILPMARYCRKRGLTLRFIEFMDVGNCNGWRMERVVPARQVLRLLQEDCALEPVEPGYTGEVASRYRYAGTDTEIGLITSVTEPFCRDCHRARLSADGRLFTCLFAIAGTDLKTPLRAGVDDEAMLELIRHVWRARGDRYSEERAEHVAAGEMLPKVEMSYIGG